MTAFPGLVAHSYGCILADPPWNFASGDSKSARQHYRTMDLADIARLPVRTLALPDCALLLWATRPMLPEAIGVMEAWGFHYKSCAPWAKQSSTGATWAFGAGYIFRDCAELLLVGTIGKPEVRDRSVRSLIVAPVREHSRKPDEVYAIAERLYAGPYADLFSRQRRPGWETWGWQADKFEPLAGAAA